MNDQIMIVAALVCVTILAAVLIVVLAKTRVAQQETLQRALEADGSASGDLLRSGHLRQGESDFRRGLLLIVGGAAIGLCLLFIGGKAWVFGSLPITIGVVYLLFWRFNAPKN